MPVARTTPRVSGPTRLRNITIISHYHAIHADLRENAAFKISSDRDRRHTVILDARLAQRALVPVDSEHAIDIVGQIA